MVQIVVEPPEQCRPGCHFDEAVQSETDQGDGPGYCPGANRDQPFESVVDDGEVFEPLAAANQFTAVWCGGGRHDSIICCRRDSSTHPCFKWRYPIEAAT